MSGAIITSKEIQKQYHSEDFKDEMVKLHKARISVVMVRTREMFRCHDVLHSIIVDDYLNEGRPDEHKIFYEFKTWDAVKGWMSYMNPHEIVVQMEAGNCDIDGDVPIKNEPSTVNMIKAFEELDKALDYPEGIYPILNAQHMLENPVIVQHIKRHINDNSKGNRCLVFIVPEGYAPPPALENDFMIVDFKTPSYPELKDSLDELSGETMNNVFPGFTDEDFDLIIQNSIGMSKTEFQVALSIAIIENKKKLTSKVIKTEKLRTRKTKSITAQDIIDVIMRYKVDIIKRTEILELMPTANMLSVGGLDILKKWLTTRKDAFSDEAKKYGVAKPKGILVVGPPGTGKSLLAKATASVFGVPCIKFDISRVFGQFVGQSETQMRRALKMVESMSPCCLMIDEIDKGLGGMGNAGDSGTTSRVFGQLLTWLQERDADNAPIFVVMTANNVSQLPPELMRRGRLDEIFAVTFPTLEERKTILQIHVEKRGHTLEDKDLMELAHHTANFVGAELESIVADALMECFHEKKPALTKEAVMKQAKSIVPISKAFGDKVEAMRKWAEQNAKPASSNVSFAVAPATGDKPLFNKKKKLNFSSSDLSSN